MARFSTPNFGRNISSVAIISENAADCSICRLDTAVTIMLDRVFALPSLNERYCSTAG